MWLCVVICSATIEFFHQLGQLYFMWNGIRISDGGSLPLVDIGQRASNEDPGLALVCVTNDFNTQCCRGSDGGAVGDWFFPDNTMIPRGRDALPDSVFIRTASAQQVVLNRRLNTDMFGSYMCTVPGVNNTASISARITLSKLLIHKILQQ
jgi:hypothetical protein